MKDVVKTTSLQKNKIYSDFYSSNIFSRIFEFFSMFYALRINSFSPQSKG